MRVGFIGAGKVGTAVGIFLKEKGVNVSGYYSRTFASALRSSYLTMSNPYNKIEELVEKSELIIITTPDDNIETIVNKLFHSIQLLNGKIICHMSGVHSSDIFKLLQETEVTICSLHPMFSFNNPQEAAKELGTAYFTLEGNGKRMGEVEQLLNLVGLSYAVINTADKILYHTAATVLSNYLVSLLDTGFQMLLNTGFTREKAMELAYPLIQNTLNNVKKNGTERALTGPIIRGDIGTVEKHIYTLKKYKEDWLSIYTVLGLHTIDLANRSGKLNDANANKLKEVLLKNE